MLQITVDDFANYKDLPDEIPALLVLGTPVTGKCACGLYMCCTYVAGRMEAMSEADWSLIYTIG